MIVISDMGTDVVNTENVFSLSIGAMQDGTSCLVAYATGLNIVLAAVGDRPNRALVAIVEGVKQRRHVLDLVELLGPRPNLAVASAIVGSNGEKLVG
jgi:hypothetical protein